MRSQSLFALVTGASTGIGRAVATEFGKLGYTTILVARNSQGLEETKQFVTQVGGSATIYSCDLSQTDQVISLATKITADFNHLDTIINIAGIWHGQNQVYADTDFEKFTSQVILDTINVGLTAPTLLIHQLLPIMPPHSHIVNLSGTFESGAKGWLPYYVSKRAIEDLTAGLAEELGDKPIYVNCVSPSDTATPQYQKYFPEDAADANSPQDIAKLIADITTKQETGKFYVIKKTPHHPIISSVTITKPRFISP